jgi:hypothetical protein
MSSCNKGRPVFRTIRFKTIGKVPTEDLWIEARPIILENA